MHACMHVCLYVCMSVCLYVCMCVYTYVTYSSTTTTNNNNNIYDNLQIMLGNQVTIALSGAVRGPS